MNKNIDDMSFQEALGELESTINILESNTLELEESLDKYKYGIELMSKCKKRLDNAQIQVDELLGKIEADDISDDVRDTTIS